ncbi:hypothetical protein LguiA_029358 [Lonicera macranthoides]
MKIQCDVCEKAAATVICCADEAALCAKCDTEVHAANKLASKHQRLMLQSTSNKLNPCDICQEKAALIFCVEDRALLCRDCDQSIHSTGSRAANHQRLLATGIRVALHSNPPEKDEESHLDPPLVMVSPPPTHSKNAQQNIDKKIPSQQQQQQQQQVPSGFTSPSWAAVDELLHFSDFDSSPDKKEQLGFEELDWFKDIGMFDDQQEFGEEHLAAAEVPQLPPSYSQPSNSNSYRQTKYYTSNKKPRINISDDDDDLFTVPDFTVPDLG